MLIKRKFSSELTKNNTYQNIILIFVRLGSLQRLKTKKRDALSSVSLSVPLTLPTSNSFYENVDELYSLKETLIQQGILNGEGNGLALARD